MKKIFILGILCLGLSSLLAQTVQISGTVTGADDGLPLPGVTVMVKGALQGTVTNADGRYSLTVPENAILQFSFVGMLTQEIAVAGRQVIDVMMESGAHSLEEIVIVGYGNQTQRSLASSVTIVKTEGLKDIPSPSFDQMLQGRAAGVNITNPNAGVGQAPIVTIRGVSTINSGTQPLYVIDGMPMISGELASLGNANALADINPADIETMTILKDAAATAIYGSRAANGVILITTKRGKQGAVKVNYDMNVGISVPTKFYEVMNAKEYVDFKTKAFKNAGMDTQVHLWNENHEPWREGEKWVDTNWSDQIYRNGTVQNHTLSISNATDKSDYYLSINRAQQGGIVIGDAYDRTGIRANGSISPMKYLKLGMNANYSYGHTKYTDASRNNGTFSVAGFPRVATIMPPNIPVRNLDGTPYFEAGNGIGGGPNDFNVTYFNPIAGYELGNKIDTWVSRMIAGAFAELTPIDGLKLKTQYGMDFALTEDKRQWNPIHGDGYSWGGLANGRLAKDSQWTWTNTASYNTTIAGDHNIGAVIGIESSQTKYSWWGVDGDDVSDPSFMGIETGFSTYDGGGNIYEKTLLSYLANLNYSFRNTYILSANFRRDGYSPLGVNSRWGNFWGVAAAWRISEEEFFRGVSAINDLKLKVSYGKVGNTDIGWYPSQSYYSANYYGGAGSLLMQNIGDANLKWESTGALNAGFELQLLDRITVNADWYQKKSIDLILGVAQAPSTGIYGSRLTTNAGQVQNTGVELTVSADVVKGRDFTWNTTLNISFNKNEVLKLTEDITHAAEATGGVTNITVEGKSIGQLFLYPTGGIDPETGRRIFFGSQGEKVYYSHAPARWLLDDGTPFGGDIEQVICGNTLPTYFGGWTNTFMYKGLDLNLFFQFTGGNHIFNGMKATASDMRFWNNSKEAFKEHWTEDNRNATYAKPVWGDNVSNGSAFNMSDYKEKGDYLRLKNVSLGYSFNTRNWFTNSGFGISSLRIYAQAQNLFVITKYSGQDPETITNVDYPIVNGGIDKNTLPQARSFTFGLNVSF